MNGTIDPDVFAAQLYEWVRSSPTDHGIGALMGVVKIRERDPDAFPWGHGAYSQSALALGGTTSYDGGSVEALTGRFSVVFSDRRSEEADCRFADDRTDIQDVTLFEDGRVRIVLRTWGDTVLWLDRVRCHAEGFLTGLRREGNGDAIVTLALQGKVRDALGVHDWP